MNFFFWIIFGLLTGIIANIIDPHPQIEDWFGTTILGILGAILGGFLGNILFGIGIHRFDLSSLVVAVSGSFLLLFINRLYGKA